MLVFRRQRKERRTCKRQIRERANISSPEKHPPKRNQNSQNEIIKLNWTNTNA